MPTKHRKKRVPKLRYTNSQKIGWHASYRDPETGSPRRKRFGMVSQEEAEVLYHEWVVSHLRGEAPAAQPKPSRRKLTQQLATPKPSDGSVATEAVPGSLLEVTSGLLHFEQSRIASDDGVRRKGTITKKTYGSREQFAQEFLKFLNTRHGQGAAGRITLTDLQMHDIEAYNQLLVSAGYSASQVKKRMRLVKAIIDRAGRPEYGEQLLAWNWKSRDVAHGKATESRKLPTLKQLKLILSSCDSRRTAMVWMAIGCGFGQRDLAKVYVNQFDKRSYDLRRSKTGIERYGETPKLVWTAIKAHLAESPRKAESLMFVTDQGMPVVHGNSDSIGLWWQRLRKKLGKPCDSLGGFYSLRHLGATEFGSRPGSSIGEMKRWLGHSASSQVADVYMKPVSPENKAVVEWVRKSLKSGKVDLSPRKQ